MMIYGRIDVEAQRLGTRAISYAICATPVLLGCGAYGESWLGR
jgi:hypothetical protein